MTDENPRCKCWHQKDIHDLVSGKCRGQVQQVFRGMYGPVYDCKCVVFRQKKWWEFWVGI